MENKLHPLIAEILHLPLEKITDDLAMNEVESWDSLQHMNLIASLEQTFGVELTFDEIVAMKNVREIKRVLSEKGVNT